LKWWDVIHFREQSVINLDVSAVRALCCSANLRWFAIISGQERLMMIDTDTGIEEELSYGDSVTAFTALALSADETTLVASATNHTIGVWKRVLGTQFSLHHTLTLPDDVGKLSALTLTPNGRILFAGCTVGDLVVCDLNERTFRRASGVHSDEVTSVTVVPNSGLVATTSLDQSVRLLDMSKLQPVAAFGGDSGMLCFTQYGRGRKVVVGEESGRVHFLDLLGFRSGRRRGTALGESDTE
jgi:WD40 repeat protein